MQPQNNTMIKTDETNPKHHIKTQQINTAAAQLTIVLLMLKTSLETEVIFSKYENLTEFLTKIIIDKNKPYYSDQPMLALCTKIVSQLKMHHSQKPYFTPLSSKLLSIIYSPEDASMYRLRLENSNILTNEETINNLVDSSKNLIINMFLKIPEDHPEKTLIKKSILLMHNLLPKNMATNITDPAELHLKITIQKTAIELLDNKMAESSEQTTQENKEYIEKHTIKTVEQERQQHHLLQQTIVIIILASQNHLEIKIPVNIDIFATASCSTTQKELIKSWSGAMGTAEDEAISSWQGLLMAIYKKNLPGMKPTWHTHFNVELAASLIEENYKMVKVILKNISAKINSTKSIRAYQNICLYLKQISNNEHRKECPIKIFNQDRCIANFTPRSREKRH